ncbi:MAG: oxidoreductase [Rhizobiales bacterium 24-66-13]|jgi:uncharacterized protein (DUF934 family)|nr:MAG: oxidoreductase [Rhizobiales bacterium 12-66-7]OYY82303.1 MAG: oxidoreductase [Rhizobiales bacterium 35-66-30]OYZ75126.1 MAG: oxidoreductase [Rhizobiales bacterium 24-66-13]OZB03952.1 MAG: oxidoreductase [Rhizobiales bacterium 39-66-18]HQS09818.1 DUF934 domain-containing protein [Xanthobacteraceae bacterium]
MSLVKNGVAAADPFVRVEDGAPLPSGPALIPLARFLAEHEALAGRNEPVGVLVPNDADVRALEQHLHQIALIVLTFPKFRDGRAYTQARLLRERLSFTGELRAAGNVLRDQLLMMVRCGFNAFEISKPSDAGALEDALKTYSVFYQPTADGRPTALRARLAAARQG